MKNFQDDRLLLHLPGLRQRPGECKREKAQSLLGVVEEKVHCRNEREDSKGRRHLRESRMKIARQSRGSGGWEQKRSRQLKSSGLGQETGHESKKSHSQMAELYRPRGAGVRKTSPVPGLRKFRIRGGARQPGGAFQDWDRRKDAGRARQPGSTLM